MVSKKVKLVNELGMHARPATLIVKKANKYRSDFYIKKGEDKVNGKSIMGVMSLAAGKGTNLELIADGVDEEYLIKEIVNLINDKFGED